jgi:hypothetical protein
MNREAAKSLARAGTLYPSLILHGGTSELRLEAAVDLARTLLCDAPVARRPCGACAHCRRVSAGEEAFHPDFRILRRDLKTATSVDATRAFLRLCQQAPFEARGQVLVLAEAESLTGEAANTLLKILEEPPVRAPRNFLLLAPAQQDLLQTLRSRSWSLYLGHTTAVAPERIDLLADEAEVALGAWETSGAAVYLLSLAGVLEAAGDWSDPRSEPSWALAAAAVKRLAERRPTGSETRRRLLDLAQELLEGPQWRVRSIAAGRILEGVVAKHLG